jgi:5-methylcytosine-specific restriction endonuclease McrA
MVNAPTLSSLDADALARRLRDLVRDERDALVEFLQHLDEFDRRRAWAEAGHDSLWSYCLRVLHLREGPAGRRIGAMRVLRRFPALADALRDGRLCLSTITLVAPLLTASNLDEIVASAAYLTKAEVEHLVATLQPRAAPRDGLRLVARADGGDAPSSFDSAALRSGRTEGGTTAEQGSLLGPTPTPTPTPTSTPTSTSTPTTAPTPTSNAPPASTANPPPALAPRASRPTLTPVAADTYSLRVTLDSALKADLDELTALLSHKVPDGDLAAVLREAIRCAIVKHATRKGARAPAQKRAPCAPRPRAASVVPTTTSDRPQIPAEIRRVVWKRDAGRCTWTAPDGRRCESRWRLELDHVVPVALGGASTVDGLRLLCRVHNQLHAQHVFGAEHMGRFRREDPAPVRSLIPG